jgi:tight adherence protein C
MSYGLIAIILIIVSIACVALAFSSKIDETRPNKRVKAIFDENKKIDKLKDIDLSESKGLVSQFHEGENSKSVRMLRKGQEIFKLNDTLHNSSLRLMLAQSGYRGAKSLATYVMLRLFAPPTLGIVTAAYIYFVFPHIVGTPLRYIIFILLATAIGYYLPVIFLRNKKNKRQETIKQVYPDMLDLILICTESGMSVEVALRRVCEELGDENSTALKDELELLTAELSYLTERRMAYENFAKRTDIPQVRALTSMIIQAELYGTPVSQALRVLSEESRDERMSEAERKAASLPSKLTVPMMIFFMPTLFIVIMTPAVLQIMDNFATR